MIERRGALSAPQTAPDAAKRRLSGRVCTQARYGQRPSRNEVERAKARQHTDLRGQHHSRKNYLPGSGKANHPDMGTARFVGGSNRRTSSPI